RDSWKDRPPQGGAARDRTPREKPHGDPLRDTARRPGQRPFAPNRFGRSQVPGESTPSSPRPTPDRGPRPGYEPKPTPPPRTNEPEELPPGPPERGRLVKKKRQ